MKLKKPIAQPGCSKRKMRKYKRTREIERKRLDMIVNEGIEEFETFPSMAKERESGLYPYQKEMIDKLPDNKTGIFFRKTGNVEKSTDSPEIIKK